MTSILGISRMPSRGRVRPRNGPAERFVESFVTSEPRSRTIILGEAKRYGLTDWKARVLLEAAEGQGLIHRWQTGGNRPSTYATVPPVCEASHTQRNPVCERASRKRFLCVEGLIYKPLTHTNQNRRDWRVGLTRSRIQSCQVKTTHGRARDSLKASQMAKRSAGHSECV